MKNHSVRYFYRLLDNRIFVFIIFLVLSFIWTYPLIRSIFTAIPGDGMDAYQVMWNRYTFWSALLQGQNPFYTHEIFYPIGTSLFFHWYGVFPSLPGVFFGNNSILFVNALVLLSYTLCGYAMYYYIRSLTGRVVPAFIAGILYAFSPINQSFVLTQHYYFLTAAVFFPVVALFCHFFWTKAKLTYLFGIILCFWASFFSDYNVTILLLLFILSAFVVHGFLAYVHKTEVYSKLFSRKSLATLSAALLMLIVPFLLLMLFVIPPSTFIRNNTFQDGRPYSCNARLEGFLIPSDKSAFLSQPAQILSSMWHFERSGDTPSYFLGYSTIILFVISIIVASKKYRRTVLILSIFAVISFFMSVGTSIRFGDAILIDNNLTPFYYFSRLPLMNIIGCTIRYPLGLQFSIAAIIGLGLAIIHKRYIVLGLAAGLIIFEYLPLGMPIQEVTVPAVYYYLAQQPDKRTVLELPSGLTESQRGYGYDYSIANLHGLQMYWQTIHHKPRVGGYTSRIDESVYTFMQSDPVLKSLFDMSSYNGTWAGRSFTDQEIRTFLSTYNVGYIVIPRNERGNRYLSVVQQVFSGYIKNIYSTDDYVLIMIK